MENIVEGAGEVLKRVRFDQFKDHPAMQKVQRAIEVGKQELGDMLKGLKAYVAGGGEQIEYYKNEIQDKREQIAAMVAKVRTF